MQIKDQSISRYSRLDTVVCLVGDKTSQKTIISLHLRDINKGLQTIKHKGKLSKYEYDWILTGRVSSNKVICF